MINSNSPWTRFANVRLSRRRAIGGAAVAIGSATAMAVAGCGGGGKTNPLTPRSGGTLRTGTTLALSSGLDPQIEQGTGLAIFPRIYGYLLHVDPRDDTVIKDHAESIEQPDPTTYIFKLRAGVAFQDVSPVNGRSVTAADVVASMLRYRDNPVVPSKLWHTTILDKVEAVDGSTVRVTTKRPYIYTLQEIGAIGAGAILPSEVVQAQTNLTSVAAGSGPFKLERASNAEGARIVRHDKYYRAPIPYIDAMEWTIFSDDDGKVAAFKRKELDVIPNRDASEAKAIAEEFGEHVVGESQPSLSYISLGLRMDRPPFNDERVRGACDLALDRDAMIRDVAFGEGDVLGPVNPHLASGYWSLPQPEVTELFSGAVGIEERRAGARALLEAASATGAAFKLQVPNVPQLIDVATVVRDHLQRIGLAVTLDEMDLIAWFTKFRAGSFEATLISQLPHESPDVPTRLYHSRGPDGTANPFGFADGTVDTLLERSWGETDRSARRSTLLEAQRVMVKGRPMLQLFSGVGHTSAWSYVRNRQPELPGSLAQYNYEQWLAPLND